MREDAIATKLSVLVCTHNPRKPYFDRCLAALRDQTLSYDEWELVVIDNKSEVPLQSRLDLSWHPSGRLVREEKLGLTPARLMAIRESTGELLVFVDDDNVLDLDFLEQVIRTSHGMPFLGSWSGQCRPEFESEPPSWTRRYWGNLVIRQFDSNVWSNIPRLAETMPCGAGLCVRRAVARHYLELHERGERTMQLDRQGTSLLSGGDNDLAACACLIGLGMGLVKDLRLTHLLPAERFTEEHLERLIEGIQFSSVVLDSEYGLRPARRSIARRFVDIVRLMRLPQPHRRMMRASFRGYDRGIAWLESAGRISDARLETT